MNAVAQAVGSWIWNVREHSNPDDPGGYLPEDPVLMMKPAGTKTAPNEDIGADSEGS